MDAHQVITRMTRLTVFGQVVLGAWIVPAFLASWSLQGTLGHVSGAVLIPLAWQTLVGMLMHAVLVLTASPKAITSYGISLGIALMATAIVVTVASIRAQMPLQSLLSELGRIGIVLLVIATVSTVLGCFLARREIKNPSLG